MKGVVAVLACCLGLAACGGSAATSATTSPSGTLYTNARYRFTVRYSPATFRPKATKPFADTFFLQLIARNHSVVNIEVVATNAQSVSNKLSNWHKGTLGTTSLNPWMQYVRPASTAYWTTLNGVRGITFQWQGPDTTLLERVLASGSELYDIEAIAPTKSWAAEAPKLEAVVQTFHVTQ